MTTENLSVVAPASTVSPAPQAPPQNRPRRPSVMPYTDVQVVIGYTDESGNRQETVHTIDTADRDIRIISAKHEVVEKQRQCKEDGQLVGFEPTGEYVLNLSVKYVKD